MKKIIVLAACFTLGLSAYAQDYKREGKEFSQVQQVKEKSSNEKTGFTWKDSKGQVYDIYISRKNACYILKTSKKTGKQYRQYLPKEVSQQIAYELGRDNTVDYN